MSSSVLRWVALNLRCIARSGSRRRILSRIGIDGRRRSIEGVSEAILGPGWSELAEAELERARRFGARILTLDDEEYPVLLRVSCDPPPTLYLWGRLRSEDMLAVSVVGSRRATPRGTSVARSIAADLAARGFCIVSGLARGIDAAGHRGALEASGRTLAVLGSGLDRIYPVEHRKLAEAIAGRGAVLTEFPFGTPPLRRHFPERNRVIAWLSWATVVIEATHDSGSLITAGLAVDEGRSVHAVPGSVGCAESEGTNALLRDGAHICRGADDILEDLAPQLIEAARILRPDRSGGAPGGEKNFSGSRSGADRPSITDGQRRVLECLLRSEGMSIERLGEACGMDPGPLLAALLELELLGLVRQLPGRRFMASACKI